MVETKPRTKRWWIWICGVHSWLSYQVSTTRQPSGELYLSQVHNTSSMFSSTWLHPRLWKCILWNFDGLRKPNSLAHLNLDGHITSKCMGFQHCQEYIPRQKFKKNTTPCPWLDVRYIYQKWQWLKSTWKIRPEKTQRTIRVCHFQLGVS